MVTPRGMVLDVPGLRLVSLTNGAQWARYQTAGIKKKQYAAMDLHVLRRALKCPLTPPLDVTIVRIAPGRFDSDNAVASAKYVRDWLARWVGVNDKHDEIVSYTVTQEKAGPFVYGVRVSVRERRE